MATSRAATEHSGIPVTTVRQIATGYRRAAYGFPPATRNRPNTARVLPVEPGLRQGLSQTRVPAQASTTRSTIPASPNASVANRRSLSAPTRPDRPPTRGPTQGTRALPNFRPAAIPVQRAQNVDPISARALVRAASQVTRDGSRAASVAPTIKGRTLTAQPQQRGPTQVSRDNSSAASAEPTTARRALPARPQAREPSQSVRVRSVTASAAVPLLGARPQQSRLRTAQPLAEVRSLITPVHTSLPSAEPEVDHRPRAYGNSTAQPETRAPSEPVRVRSVAARLRETVFRTAQAQSLERSVTASALVPSRPRETGLRTAQPQSLEPAQSVRIRSVTATAEAPAVGARPRQTGLHRAETQTLELSRTAPAHTTLSSTEPAGDHRVRAFGRPTTQPETRVYRPLRIGIPDSPLLRPLTETSPERNYWDEEVLPWSPIRITPPRESTLGTLSDAEILYLLEKTSISFVCADFRMIEECPICLELIVPGETIRRLPCMHLFHNTCVDLWILSGKPLSFRCPMCMILVLRNVPQPYRYTVAEFDLHSSVGPLGSP